MILLLIAVPIIFIIAFLQEHRRANRQENLKLMVQKERDNLQERNDQLRADLSDANRKLMDLDFEIENMKAVRGRIEQMNPQRFDVSFKVDYAHLKLGREALIEEAKRSMAYDIAKKILQTPDLVEFRTKADPATQTLTLDAGFYILPLTTTPF